jgi:hypothetical protein
MIEAMKAGESLVWEWTGGRLTLPLAGFEEVFKAVSDYRGGLIE